MPFKARILLWQEYNNVNQKQNIWFWCAFPTARAVSKLYLKHIWWSNWKLCQHWNYKEYIHIIIEVVWQQKEKENIFYFPIFINLLLKLKKLHRNYFETLIFRKFREKSRRLTETIKWKRPQCNSAWCPTDVRLFETWSETKHMGCYQTKVRPNWTVKQQMLSCERCRGTDHTVEELNTAVESLLQEFLQL